MWQALQSVDECVGYVLLGMVQELCVGARRVDVIDGGRQIRSLPNRAGGADESLGSKAVNSAPADGNRLCGIGNPILLSSLREQCAAYGKPFLRTGRLGDYLARNDS